MTKAVQWIDAVIAPLVATFATYFLFPAIMKVRMAHYVKLYPHDGQDVLGALWDALG